MHAAPASRRSVELNAKWRGRRRGLTSDHRGTRRAVMIEFYTTMRATGRRPGIRCNEGWFRAGHIRGITACSLSRPLAGRPVSGARAARGDRPAKPGVCGCTFFRAATRRAPFSRSRRGCGTPARRSSLCDPQEPRRHQIRQRLRWRLRRGAGQPTSWPRSVSGQAAGAPVRLPMPSAPSLPTSPETNIRS